MLYNPYSVSRLNTHDSCPKKFKLFYIDKIKIKGEPILALEKGSFSHFILENLIEIEVKDIKDIDTNKYTILC